MEYKYEIVKFNDNYPAKIYLQNKPGRRCNTSIHWHKAMELLYIIDGHLNVMEDGKITELNSGSVYFVNHDCFQKPLRPTRTTTSNISSCFYHTKSFSAIIRSMSTLNLLCENPRFQQKKSSAFSVR